MKVEKSIRALLVSSILILLILFGSLPFSYAIDKQNPESPERNFSSGITPSSDYVPGQVIVKFKSGLFASQDASQMLFDSDIINTVLDKLVSSGEEVFQLLGLNPDVSVESAVQALSSLPFIEFAEPNYRMEYSYSPNDPSYPSQWGFNNTGQSIEGVIGIPDADIDAPEAWDLERGQTNPVTVAVIDSGVDFTHPDLDGKLWTNPGEIPNNGIDDDGNSCIDDYYGYNWAGISQTNWTNNPWDLGSSYEFQNFTQSIKGTGQILYSVELELSKVGSPSQNIVLQVQNDTGTVLADASISPGEVGTSPTFVEKQLSSYGTLTYGSTYYIVIGTANNNVSNHYHIYDNPNTYAEGSLWKHNGTLWEEQANYDLYFRTNYNYYPYDDNGHGTHCAGVVGAETNNGTGISGTSPGTKIMPLKIGDCNGSSFSWYAAGAIRYATDMGADIISMSFSSTSYSSTLADAINYAHAGGVTMFAAVGNDGAAEIRYPAGYNYVIGVGGTNNQDTYYANTQHNSSVDISAPGVDIYSTVPVYPVSNTIVYGDPLNYAYYTGTSMSCPMAAGLGALILSRNPTLTPDQVEQIIKNTADDKGAVGRDDYYGYGRINAYQALVNTPQVFTVSASVSGGHGTVSPPSQTVTQGNAASISISPSTGYHIESVTDNGTAKTITNPYIISNVASAHNVVVTFAINTYTVNASAPSGHGAVNPASQVVNYGASATITIAPDVDYHIESITDNGAAKTVTSSYTISGVNQNHNVVVVFAPTPPSPYPMDMWYLAEGCTDGGFETWVLVENPTSIAAQIDMDFLTSEGNVQGPVESIPANSRRSYNVGAWVTTYNVSTQVTVLTPNGKVVCERAMYGNNRTWGHDSLGATSPSSVWYLAEGCTGGDFETWVLVQNPNDAPVTIDMDFQSDAGQIQGAKESIPAKSRRSYNVSDYVTSYNVSTKVTSTGGDIVCERSMYGNGREWGHNSGGVAAPASTWYLAEGCTGGDFETWILVQNPNAEVAKVQISFQTDSGTVNGPKEDIAPNSRRTYNVSDYVTSYNVSTKVTASQGTVVCERAMYGGNRTWGHDSVGATSPFYRWCLAEGCTDGGFETWILVQNPTGAAVTVQLQFTDGTSITNGPTETIPPYSRKSYNAGDYVTSYNVSTIVTATNGDIVCERAMYGNNRTWGHDSIGFPF